MSNSSAPPGATDALRATVQSPSPPSSPPRITVFRAAASCAATGSDVVRSAVSGKRIKLKVDKSAEDRARAAGRREMLRYMHAVSAR